MEAPPTRQGVFGSMQKPWLSTPRGTLNLLRKLTKEPYLLKISKKIQKANGMGLALTHPSATYFASIASMTMVLVLT